MLTIRAGKLFVDKYNLENNSKLSPKEVFRVLCEKVFTKDKKGRLLVHWNNTKFDEKQKKNGDFNNRFKLFCSCVEDSKYGLETMTNVYCGCAYPTNPHREAPTTEFCFCDNLHFTNDERYFSFIGAILSVRIGSWQSIIEDSEVLWVIFKEAIDSYREELNGDDKLKGNQLETYNGCFLYYYYLRKMQGRGVSQDEVRGDVHEKFLTKDKDKYTTISFRTYIDLLVNLIEDDASRKDVLSILKIWSNSQTNSSSGILTIENFDSLVSYTQLYRNIYKSLDGKDLSRTFCTRYLDSRLLSDALENGGIYDKMVDPLNANISRMDSIDKKFITNIICMRMTKEEMTMAEKLCEYLKGLKGRKNKYGYSIDDILSNSKPTVWVDKFNDFLEKIKAEREDWMIDIVKHFLSDDCKCNLKDFNSYIKFNLNFK